MPRDLVHELLNIQSYKDESINQRYDWANVLRFLHLTNDPRRLVLKKERTEKIRGQYIALSHTWSPAPGEDTRAGAFVIENSPRGSHVRSEVRNVVLQRVLRFARYKKVTRVWIDKECINQSKRKEKLIAVQCMDFVYSRSKFPLGLFNVCLKSQVEINILELLLEGGIVSRAGIGWPVLRRRVSRSLVYKLLHLIKRLARDPWLTRRWTFQEEYKSFYGMTLLIPHLKRLRKSKRFAGVKNEFRVKAVELRTEITLFVLALCKTSAAPEWKTTKGILDALGSYKILDEVGFGRRLALTPRLLLDLGRRKSRDIWDVLDILANTCGFKTRLSTINLQRTNISFGACVATLYFINGEVFNNRERYSASLNKKMIMAQLANMSASIDGLPDLMKVLSYAKHCRFQNPRLVRKGVLTEGILWQFSKIVDGGLIRKVDVSKLPLSQGCGLNEFQRGCLYGLANELRNMDDECETLRQALLSYLRDDARTDHTWAAKEYMDCMAEEVVDAIRRQANIHLACDRVTREILGIFVDVPPHARHAFTSWSAPERDETIDWSLSQKRHISLAVEVQESETRPSIRKIRWVSGLVFTFGIQPHEVIYCWPPNWT